MTVVQGFDGGEIVVMYRQFDGYPTGMGRDLKEFLGHTRIVNGFSNHRAPDFANGMGCLAAQIVEHFKDGIGGIYLHPAGKRDIWEDYIYTVYARGKPDDDNREVGLGLRVEACGDPPKVLFDGPISDFDPEACERGE